MYWIQNRCLLSDGSDEMDTLTPNFMPATLYRWCAGSSAEIPIPMQSVMHIVHQGVVKE